MARYHHSFGKWFAERKELLLAREQAAVAAVEVARARQACDGLKAATNAATCMRPNIPNVYSGATTTRALHA